MAGHVHIFKESDFGLTFVTTATEGDPHTHMIELPDGRMVETTPASPGEGHTHSVGVGTRELTSSGPRQSGVEAGEPAVFKAKAKKKKKPKYSAALKKLVKAHNDSMTDPLRKVELRYAHIAQNRGEAMFAKADTPGTSKEAWGLLRVARLLKFAAEADGGYCPDAELLNRSHPALGAGDAWAAVITEEEKIALLQKQAVESVERGVICHVRDDTLVTMYKQLAELHKLHFADPSVEASVTGLQRPAVVASLALIVEELDRRNIAKYDAASPAVIEAQAHLAAGARIAVEGTLAQLGPDLLLDVGFDHQFRIAAQRPGSPADVTKAAACWAIKGSRYHQDLSAEYVPYSIAVDATDAVPIAAFTVEKGSEYKTAAGEREQEFFLSGAVCGVLRVRKDSLSLNHGGVMPHVLQPEAAPEVVPGESGLPLSLELDVPPALRFWKAAPGEDPTVIRDALVSAGLLNNVAPVDAQLRAVRWEPAVPDHYGTAPRVFAAEPDYEAAVAKATACVPAVPCPPAAVTQAVAEALAKADDWADLEGPLVCLLDEALAESITAEALAKKLCAAPHDYVVGYPAGPGAVAKLQAAGPVFEVPGVDDVVFVTSRAPAAPAQTLRILSDPAPTTKNTPAPAPAERTELHTILKRETQLLKADEEERLVFGIVLEPEVIDAQNDIYSEEEVRRAAHLFMEEFGNTGLMHQAIVNDQVKVLESFVAPVAMTINKVKIKKGTWLMAMRVKSEELWQAVKTQKLTGFSIGGHSLRNEESQD